MILLISTFSCTEYDTITLPVQISDQHHQAISPSNRNSSTHLNGAQERPNPVDTKAQGQAKFKLSKDGSSLHFKLNVANIENVLMAHLHRITDPSATTGGIVVWLYPDGPPPQLIPGRSNGTLAEGDLTSSNLTGSLAGMSLDDLIEEMNAGNIYVNVHTSQHPPGEIRGDIKGDDNEPS